MRHRLTDVVRDTIVYGSLKDMYDGLQLMHEVALALLQPLRPKP